MSAPLDDNSSGEGLEHAAPTVVGNYDEKSGHISDDREISNEKLGANVDSKHAPEVTVHEGEELCDDGVHNDTVIIRSGQDAASHLLSLRDDMDPALTFRSLFIATGLCAFQSVMYQIYMFKPTAITIQGTFIVVIAYFVGKAWSVALPRGDKQLAKWRANGGEGKVPLKIRIIEFINPRAWSLKEHAICAITATSASNAAPATQVFAAQKLFYDMPLQASTVILSTISIGLFGYGLCGLMRPICVWHVEAVYWSNIPTVKTLQALHWQDLKNNKPLRWFWYALGGMFLYEFLPAYIWPWLNSVSIPCLAAMHVTGSKATTITNIFGGATNNEGLGLFTMSFDWQYLTSFQTSLPLDLQIHQAVGLFICFFAMLGVYYSNTWGAKSLPFMSTSLKQANGTTYPTADVFVGGILDESALATYGLPKLTGTFAYSLLMANAAIGALLTHCILFWGGDVVKTFKSAKKGIYNDRHHEHMAKNYKETPWWWFLAVLVIAFVLGLVVVIKDDVTLPPWAFIVSLLMGTIIAPFSTLLYSRFGNGIATNNLSKMVAGLAVPGRPVGNMYFAQWSHNVILCAVDLSADLKMGEYLKIPPRVMFLTQIWGTIFGGFINYVVMISIVTGNAELLATGNGDSSWSGATMQSYNTNATAWALAKYLYKTGKEYQMVPMGMLIGAALVAVHRIVYVFIPKVKVPYFGWISLAALNLPQLIQYAGYIPYNQSQTCVIMTWIVAGFFVQFYLRNFKPLIFKDYSYLIAGAFDGASLLALFILSFAVFGAGGPSRPFPSWWGNNVNGNYDFCPIDESS